MVRVCGKGVESLFGHADEHGPFQGDRLGRLAWPHVALESEGAVDDGERHGGVVVVVVVVIGGW